MRWDAGEGENENMQHVDRTGSRHLLNVEIQTDDVQKNQNLQNTADIAEKYKPLISKRYKEKT